MAALQVSRRGRIRGTVPPTAGLPLRAADLLPGGDDDLAGAMAAFLGVDWAQIECSGTAALVVALQALRSLAPARHSVVVPGYTCPLVALAVAHCGLRLRICDLQPGSLDLDPDMLARLCDADTLAVLPTHLGGRVADTRAARRCAAAVGAWVIEDAAQSLGARAEGASLGTQCDIGFFSLAVGKGLTIYEGGVLVARDSAVRAACRHASAAACPARPGWELRRSAELLGYAALYRPALLRWAYRAPLQRALARQNWVAAAGDDFDVEIPLHRVGRWRRAVGLRALQRLPSFLQATASQALPRAERLARIPGVDVLGDSPAVEGAEGTWPVLMLRIATPARRDALLRRLWGAGCGVSLPFVHALPDYRRYAAQMSAAAGDAVPNARDLAARLLAVSNSPWLDDARFDMLCQELNS